MTRSTSIIEPSATGASGIKLKFLPLAGLMFILFSFLPTMTVSNATKPNKTMGLDDDSYPYERAVGARENLLSIADAQVAYFAEHNQWAGYENEDEVFAPLKWKPENEGNYAYYCGDDSIIPGENRSFKKYPDPKGDWPFALLPRISVSDFICMAVGNNDRDAFPDVWMIDKRKRPTQLMDDRRDRVIVNILSEFLDPDAYYENDRAGPEGKRLSRVFIRINLPAFRLDLFEDGRRLKSYPVAIGMRGYKTPRRTFYLEKVEWNPWFYPPNANWCKKEDEKTCKPVSPGPWNPLYPVKMILQSSYLIHGTPKTSSIGRRASHGCIRMKPDDAADLAWKVMVLAGTKQPLSKREFYRDKKRKTHRMLLREPVQVNTVYERLELYDGAILLHTDPYRWQPLNAEKVKEALGRQGLEVGEFDEDRSVLLLNASPAETIAIPINR